MLQDILLSLSGHQSSLLDDAISSPDGLTDSSSLLSNQESRLLASVRHIARLHTALQSHTKVILESHPSAICKAVASSLRALHLQRFHDKILEIERSILTEDTSLVGAYNIVPLSAIANEFGSWTMLMEWYWKLGCFILPSEGADRSKATRTKACSGAAAIDRLRLDSQTGYPSIKEAATELVRVAELTWLRQLSSWILYGKLPTIGSHDFFIQIDKSNPDLTEFVSHGTLLPKSVSSQTASSILFIGKSLNHIQARNLETQSQASGQASSSDSAIRDHHLKLLMSVKSPIAPAQLTGMISSIRMSLSRHKLQQLLPLPLVIRLLSMLQEYFLLSRGEFAYVLVAEADKKLAMRQNSSNFSVSTNRVSGVKNIVLKDGEVASALSQTWSNLSIFLADDDAADSLLDLAKRIAHVVLKTPTSKRPATPGRAKENGDHLPSLSGTSFYEFLFGAPVSLTLDIPVPLEIFITSSEVNVYSAMHSYLLSIRRSHIHLSSLWKETSLRRPHPAPIGPPLSNLPHGQASVKTRRAREARRNAQMRETWATCGAAIFLLSEVTNYFEGEVLRKAWEHFHEWMSRSKPTNGGQDEFSDSLCRDYPGEASHDPETLAKAHQHYLRTVAQHLLLTDFLFTKSLHNLLTAIEHLIALIKRLQAIRQSLDLEEDEGVVDALANYEQDEAEAKTDLARARRRVDDDMRSVVGRLRELDAGRTGVETAMSAVSLGPEDYVPWRGSGVDRLLMKLDFGSVRSEAGRAQEY